MKIDLRRTVYLLTAIAVTSGCAARSYREDGPAPATGHVSYQTQIAIGKCVFKPKEESAALAAIATALLTSAITTGVNYVGKAIEESARQTDDRVSASRNLEVSKDNFGPCILIARGWFHRGFDDAEKGWSAFERATWVADASGAIDRNKLRNLWQHRMWLAAQPDFIFEAEIIPAVSDRECPGAQPRLRTPRCTHQPGDAAAIALPRGRRIRSVARCRRGAQRAEQCCGRNGNRTPRPRRRTSVSAQRYALARVEHHPNRDPNRGSDKSEWFKVALGADKKPMTITALVTEHQDAELFQQFVADVFNGAKPAIITELQNAAVPALRARAVESAQVATEAAANQYEAALADLLAATSACASTISDPVSTATDIRAKLRTFNKTARAMSEKEFPERSVPLSANPHKVSQGCVKLRTELREKLR